MRRTRHAKIVATLGPASADHTTIRSLFEPGADVFRLNFSHGSHEQHKERLDIIRRVEREVGRQIGVLLDLQGPKLRIGTFAAGPVTLEAGAPFRLDLDRAPGNAARVPLPHPEIFAALKPGSDLLRQRCAEHGGDGLRAGTQRRLRRRRRVDRHRRRHALRHGRHNEPLAHRAGLTRVVMPR
jgi:hypothetical protein